MLGVCNGFQILTEAGLLPGALLRNAGLRFLSAGLPPAGGARRHRVRRPLPAGRGRSARRWRMATAIISPTTATLDRLEGEGLVAFRYATAQGEVTPAANRNGSARNIAGIYSPNLRVLGLMPHPEDLVDPLLGGEDGKPLFDALAAASSPAMTRHRR